MIIVSACLAGQNCRYDGKSCSDDEVISLIRSGDALMLCPEQLGGLTTPRPPAESLGSIMITDSGFDVTSHFQEGAHLAMQIVKENKVTRAIVKERSPMCGLKNIYDGSFTGNLKNQSGTFTKKLLEAGIEVESRK